MRLILVRHGQTASNVAGALDTAVPGPALTELGAAQAAALPAALAGFSVRVVFASNQRRAALTAAPLAAALALPVRIRAGLREISAGDAEMATDAAAIAGYLTVIDGWQSAAPADAGESGAEVLARFDAVVAEAAGAVGAGPGDPAAEPVPAAVLVSHGAVIRFWACARAANLVGGFRRHLISNTGVVVLDGDPDAGWQAIRWMDEAVGGPAVRSDGHDGPAGEPARPR